MKINLNKTFSRCNGRCFLSGSQSLHPYFHLYLLFLSQFISHLLFVFSHLSSLFLSFSVPLIHCFSVFHLFSVCPLSLSLSVDHQTGVCHRLTICRERQGGREDWRVKQDTAGEKKAGKDGEAVTEEDKHKESDSLTNKTNLTAEKRKTHCSLKKKKKKSLPEEQKRKFNSQSCTNQSVLTQTHKFFHLDTLPVLEMPL